jgi:choline dehydrogenase-like flavoprotein
VLPWLGPELLEVTARLAHLQGCLGITVDGLLPEEEGATVRLKPGAYSRLSIDYGFVPANWEAFRAASLELAKLQFAAGAKRVFSMHLEPVVLNSVDELGKLEAAPWGPLRQRVLSAHVMGGCQMGKDPARSVVDSTLRYHGLDNLFVVDGSVFPSGLGVNPQESIMGLSRWAARHVAAAS